MKKISVIIPVLNEEKALAENLRRFSVGPSEELIISDGGSADDTLNIARRFTDNIVSSPRGRGPQMNAGAKEATGEILLFLHADAVLPDGAFRLIRGALTAADAGAFDIKIGQAGLCFRLIERAANTRSRATKIPYGDQALFIRKDVFDSIGGFAPLPVMEDVDIGLRLGRMKKRIAFIDKDKPVKVSPRRWQKEGILGTTLRDWALAFSYLALRVSPERLARHYRDVR